MTLLGLLFLGLAYLLPGHYTPWLAFQQQFVAAAGVAVLALAACTSAKERIAWPRLALFALAFSVVPVLQWDLGQVQYKSDAVLASAYLIAFGLSIVVGKALTKADGQWLLEGLATTFLLVGIASVGLAFCQWFELGPSLYLTDKGPDSRPFANLAQPNHLATLLELALAALLYWYETRRVRSSVLLIGYCWLVFGLLMTQSRLPWVLAIVLVPLWLWLGRHRSTRLTPLAVALGAVVLAAGVLVWGPLNDALLLSAPSLATRAVSSMRLPHWKMLLDAIWQSPWVGYGWQQIATAQQSVALGHPPAFEHLSNSHSIVLDALLWNGIPLGLALLTPPTIWLAGALRRCSDGEQLAWLTAVLAIVVHALFEYPLDYTYFLLPLGLLVGAINRLQEDRPPRSVSVWSLALPSLALSVFLASIGVEYMRVEEASRQLRFVVAKVGTDKVSMVAPPETFWLDDLYEYHVFAMRQPRSGMSEEELALMARVSRRHAEPSTLFRYATALALNGKPELAERELRLICRLNQPEVCVDSLRTWEKLGAEELPELRKVRTSGIAP
jgi:hypothetical protein